MEPTKSRSLFNVHSAVPNTLARTTQPIKSLSLLSNCARQQKWNPLLVVYHPLTPSAILIILLALLRNHQNTENFVYPVRTWTENVHFWKTRPMRIFNWRTNVWWTIKPKCKRHRHARPYFFLLPHWAPTTVSPQVYLLWIGIFGKKFSSTTRRMTRTMVIR